MESRLNMEHMLHRLVGRTSAIASSSTRRLTNPYRNPTIKVHKPPFGSNQPLVDEQRRVMKRIGNFPVSLREFSTERFRALRLEDEIRNHLRAKDPAFDEGKLSQTFYILHYHYPKGELRKNRLMEKISHPLLVMLYMAILTNSQRDATTGGFHDIVEDGRTRIHSSIEHFARELEENVGYGGDGLGSEIMILSQMRDQQDFRYNVGVYASTIP